MYQINKLRDSLGRLWLDGQLYMGRSWPPLPVWVRMTDRTTSTVYTLAYTGSFGGMSADLSTTAPSTPDVRVWGPYDGPYVDDFRLYIDSGVLLAESAPDNDNQRVLMRQAGSRDFLEINVTTNGTITYTEIDTYE